VTIELPADPEVHAAGRLAVTRKAFLQGTLELALPDGANPPVGTSFQVVTGSPITGAFDTVIAAAGLEVSYGGGAVTVTVVPWCPADFDGTGDVGAGDVIILLSHWGACPSPPAECPWDLNGDGVVGNLDLTFLLSQWGPCP
jgi:hypothetical protein